MATEGLAGIVILVGSIIFFIAASMPTSLVFAEPDPAKKLEILRRSPRVWLLSQLFFSVGATVAAIGLGILAQQLRPVSAMLLGYIGTALLLVGVVFWDWHVYLRSSDPEQFVRGLIPSWLFQSYSVLTDAGLVLFGIAFLMAAYPSWMGVAMIGFPLAFLAAFLVFKDLPPFFYYVLLLIVGIVMAW